jgi:transcriptional regulator with XRE-family HTH domain
MDYTSLGGRVRQLRREKGYSQGALAEDLVDASYISMIEAGRREPQPEVLEQLAGRLDTSAYFLQTGQQLHDLQEDQLGLQFAEIALTHGDADEAYSGFAELADRRNSQIGLAARWGLARAEELRSNYRAAADLLESLIAPARSGEPGAPALLPVHMARCRLEQLAGDLTRSIEVGEQALAEISGTAEYGTEDEIKLASTLVAAFWSRGDLLSAQHLADQVISRADRLGNRNAQGSAYWNASLVAEARGDMPLALSQAERTLALLSEASEDAVLAGMRVTYAWLLLRCSPPRLGEAESQLEKAHLVLLDTDGRGSDLQNCQTEMARAALMRGDPDEALRLAEHAVSLDLGPGTASKDAQVVHGLVLLQLGQADEGSALVSAAAGRLELAGARRDAAQAWRELAEAFLQSGRADDAIGALERSTDCAGVHPPVAIGQGRRPSAGAVGPALSRSTQPGAG